MSWASVNWLIVFVISILYQAFSAWSWTSLFQSASSSKCPVCCFKSTSIIFSIQHRVVFKVICLILIHCLIKSRILNRSVCWVCSSNTCSSFFVNVSYDMELAFNLNWFIGSDLRKFNLVFHTSTMASGWIHSLDHFNCHYIKSINVLLYRVSRTFRSLFPSIFI